MNLTDLNQNWYVLFLAFLLPWFALLLARRKHNPKTEVAEQFALAFVGILVLTGMEFFAVSTNLWHYVPGDWPIMLWPTYFAAILFGYQLLRSVETVVRRIRQPLEAGEVPRAQIGN